MSQKEGCGSVLRSALLKNQVVPHVAERAAYVGGHQIKLFFGLGTKAADGQVTFEQHDRQLADVWILTRSLLRWLSSALR